MTTQTVPRHPTQQASASTQSDVQSCNTHPQRVGSERETTPTGSSRTQSAVTLRDNWRGWIAAQWEASKQYWTPPSVLTERPPTVAELAEYAWRGPWTRHPHTTVNVDQRSQKQTTCRHWIRIAGIWWHRLIGVPTTVVCRYVEWFAQRPGRTIPALLLVRLFTLTGPGAWLVDHLINPLAHGLAWALL